MLMFVFKDENHYPNRFQGGLMQIRIKIRINLFFSLIKLKKTNFLLPKFLPFSPVR